MLIALLLASSAPQTAVEAERAFAADAQAIGLWSAFRKWAADDAVMFLPQPIKAQDFLKPLKNPPKAVDWWPTASFVSCDGTTAANTGGAAWPDGHASYFSTIWSKTGGAWRWKVDHGDDLSVARPRSTVPAETRADCATPPPAEPVDLVAPKGNWASGESPDRTLRWSWSVSPDGALRFMVALWAGKAYRPVIDDRVAAPPAAP